MKEVFQLIFDLIYYVSAFVVGVIIIFWVFSSFGNVNIAFKGTYSPTSKDTHFIFIMSVIGVALTLGGFFSLFNWFEDYKDLREKNRNKR